MMMLLLLSVVAALALGGTRFMWNTCNCCCCEDWLITVNDACGGGAISGADVTIGSDTQTTDADGEATFACASRGATGTIAKSGYCTKTFTVPSNCAPTTVSIRPDTITCTFFPFFCCGGFGMDPSATYPVTVDVTQTAGGVFTDSCTATSSAGCTIDLPVPCPGSSNNTFDIQWSATDFTTVTTTLTLTSSSCPSSRTQKLVTTAGRFCWPCLDCIDTAPTSLTVTLVGNPCGPWTVPLDTLSECVAIYTDTFACGGGTVTVTVNLSINTANCGQTASVSANFSIGTPTPGTATAANLCSGSIGCPVVFEVADTISCVSPTYRFTVSE